LLSAINHELSNTKEIFIDFTDYKYLCLEVSDEQGFK